MFFVRFRHTHPLAHTTPTRHFLHSGYSVHRSGSYQSLVCLFALLILLLSGSVVARSALTTKEVETLIVELKSGTQGQRNRIIARINHLQDRRAIRALYTLADSHEPGLRRLGIWSLAALPARGGEPVYLKNLKHSNIAVRLAAIKALGNKKSQRHWRKLVAALRTKDALVQRAALLSLARMEKPGLKGFAAGLRLGTDVRLLTIEQLAHSKTRGALSLLRQAASKGEPQGRVYACRRLMSRAPEFAYRNLAALTGSRFSLGVRLQAMKALSVYPPRRVAPLYRALSRDNRREVRDAASAFHARLKPKTTGIPTRPD